MAWAEKMSSGRWRGRYYDNDGKPQSVIDGRVGFQYKQHAIEAAQRKEVDARRRAAVDAGTQSARITWSEVYRLFRDENRRPDTETAHTEDYLVDEYIESKWGDVSINQIKRRRVQSWVNKELAPGKKPSYTRRIYQAFASPLNWAADEDVGILDVSPCTKIKLPTVTKEPKPYMDEEYIAAIRPHVNSHTRRAVEFQYETGLRPSELGGLHIHRIDRRLRMLYVVDVLVSRLHVIRPSPKNEKAEEIPLSERALDILDETLDGRDPERGCGLRHADGKKCLSDVVFRTVRDVPLNPRSYYMLLYTAAQRAGVELRSPYAGRRGTATRLADAGLGIFDIASMLRHDPSQTRGYVQKTPAFNDRVRVALGDSPQLTVVEGVRDARGAPRGADLEKQPSTAVHTSDDEHAG